MDSMIENMGPYHEVIPEPHNDCAYFAYYSYLSQTRKILQYSRLYAILVPSSATVNNQHMKGKPFQSRICTLYCILLVVVLEQTQNGRGATQCHH